MQNSKWLTGVIDQAGGERIRLAVSQAEKRTSAEIVPMIVRSSMTVGHVKPMLFMSLVLLFWLGMVESGAHEFMQVQFAGSVFANSWLCDLMIAGLAYAIAHFGCQNAFVQRVFTADGDQEVSVFRRAQLELYQGGTKQTAGKTGILIMVSLVERRAVVLADEAVAARFAQDAWAPVVEVLIAGVKRGDFAGGMCAAVDCAAGIVDREFPIRAGDRNELSDKLVIKV